MLNFYTQLLRIRKQYTCIQTGKLSLLDVTNNQCLAFTRTTSDQKVGVFLNFDKKPLSISNPLSESERIFSSLYLDEKNTISDLLELNMFEGIILKY